MSTTITRLELKKATEFNETLVIEDQDDVILVEMSSNDETGKIYDELMYFNRGEVKLIVEFMQSWLELRK